MCATGLVLVFAFATLPVPARAAPRAAAFDVGQLTDRPGSGCGRNKAAEPAIHVSRAGRVFVSALLGSGAGTEVWDGSSSAGRGASPCRLSYLGRPDAVAGLSPSGGDTDLAIASARNAAGSYNTYVAGLDHSVWMSITQDDGRTWTEVPVQVSPVPEDRPFVAAYGAGTSLLGVHDLATYDDIDILRSDQPGTPYVLIAQVIPEADYKAHLNQTGNLVIDRENRAGAVANRAGTVPFWAYQAFVSNSKAGVGHGIGNDGVGNEIFIAVSNDGGYTWIDEPVGCSSRIGRADDGLNNEFPVAAVAPDATVWVTWSDGIDVYAARSMNHGRSWTCEGPVSATTHARGAAFEPWITATRAGVDVVYYATPNVRAGSQTVTYVYFAQLVHGRWTIPVRVAPVHAGSVCQSGASCTSNRQLLDDFGVDTDPNGWAHIAFTADADANGAPKLGGQFSTTFYAVQTAGPRIGASN